jgi:hypothetical protein
MAEQKSNKYDSTAPDKGNDRGMASFSTRPERVPRLGRNLSKPNLPAGLNRLAPLLVTAVICFAAGFGGGLLGASAYNHGKTLNATSTAAKQQFVSNESELISSIANSGIISGFGRDVTAGDQSGSQDNENLTDLFQTDAAINEGNSGGPLVNINGEVIGVNTAIASDAQNIGFAQPINDIKGIVSSVLGGGKIEQPYLGVRYVSLTNDLAKEFNLKVTRGAYVTSGSGQQAVVADSPADKAGVKDHDVITKVNNITIDDKTSLTAALSRFKVGDKVTLTIVRDGNKITKEATLAVLPQQ